MGLRIAAFVAFVSSGALLALSQPAPAQTNSPDAAAAMEHPAQAADHGKTKVTGSVTTPRVFFIGLKDGARVKSPFKVKFGVEGMALAKAGTATPGTGHHHLIIDGGPTPKGTIVGKDETHLHYGDAQTEATLTLPKGKHTLTLQFADGTHASYGESLSQTITVDVR